MAPSSVKTRIQADQGPKNDAKKKGQVTVRKGAGLLEGVMTIAQSKEGVMGLYRGFGASMVNTFSTRECLSAVSHTLSRLPY